jgi:hypothetical protein
VDELVSGRPLTLTFGVEARANATDQSGNDVSSPAYAPVYMKILAAMDKKFADEHGFPDKTTMTQPNLDRLAATLTRWTNEAR